MRRRWSQVDTKRSENRCSLYPPRLRVKSPCFNRRCRNRSVGSINDDDGDCVGVVDFTDWVRDEDHYRGLFSCQKYILGYLVWPNSAPCSFHNPLAEVDTFILTTWLTDMTGPADWLSAYEIIIPSWKNIISDTLLSPQALSFSQCPHLSVSERLN